MTDLYDPDRVSKLKTIQTRFGSYARVGDRILLGIRGDPALPASYRGAQGQPQGTIVKIKNEGTPGAILRVKLDGEKYGKSSVTLYPHQLSGDKVWEFADDTWEHVKARAQQPQGYRGSADSTDEVSTLRAQLDTVMREFQSYKSSTSNWKEAVVDSLHHMSNEIAYRNPDAKFSKVFTEEYRAVGKKQPSPFDSDMSDDEY